MWTKFDVMAITKNAEADKLLKFKKKRIMKKADLSDLFNCSGRTIQRKLNYWEAIRSYNHNGQYYALRAIVKFDDSGLWCYNSVCFSRYGTLKETVIVFVGKSSDGMSAKEISDALHLKNESFLTFYKNISGIKREKISGSFIYFSIDEAVYQKQKANRIAINEEFSGEQLTNPIIIQILTEKIKFPALDESAISKNLAKQGVKVAPISIIGIVNKV